MSLHALFDTDRGQIKVELFAEKAQITTLSATQGSTLAQPQRWVF